MSEQSKGSNVPTKVVAKQSASSSKQNLDNDPNKKSTKIMLHEALLELKSRKGVSYYAIKKYIADNNNVDINKVKHIIKKQLKSGVEEGHILQTKGTGASGSFKLVQMKKDKTKTDQKKEKPNAPDTGLKKLLKKTKKSAEESEKSADDNATKKSTDGTKTSADKTKKPAKKVKTNGTNEKVPKSKLSKSNSTDSSKSNKMKTMKTDIEKKTMKKLKAGISEDMISPWMKKSMLMRRKSIGSIIKPPKMKPKAK